MREGTILTDDHVETEWQFECAVPPQRWLRGAELPAGFALGTAKAEDIADTYYDTEDWRLYRAGYALRVRQTGAAREATMKQLAVAHDGRHERRELTAPLAVASSRSRAGARAGGVLDGLEGPLAERVHAVAGTHSMRPIVALRTHRRRLPIEREGRVVGELALDVTRVPVAGASVPARLHRVEVEVAPGVDAAALEPVVETWRRGIVLAPTDCSKFAAALHARGVVPAPVEIEPGAVDPSMTTGAVALATLREHFAGLLAHEPGTRLGEDPEALHDMRVAIRRLRAMLALFADALPRHAVASRATLGWIAGALGAVRDLDVQLERLEGWRTEMEPGDAEALATVADVLRRRRNAARRRMLRVLDCRRYERFVRRFTALLRAPLRRRAIARRSIVDTAPALIRKRMRKVRGAGDAITATSSPTAYHGLRIRCKRLRYALEAHVDIYGKPARRLVAAVAELQDLLGGHQDAEVAIVHLRQLCARRSPRLSSRAVFVMGAIAARYEREAKRLRRRFPRRYRAVTGSRWKRVRRAFEKSVAEVAAAVSPLASPLVDVVALDASAPRREGRSGAALRTVVAGRRGPRRNVPTKRMPHTAAR